jgi:hypothetical protein
LLSRLSRLLGLTRRELVVLAVAFSLTLPAVTPRVYASDEIQYFSYLRSLWFDHDVSFENEYQYFFTRNIGRGENFYATFLELVTDTGRRPNFGTLGAAILWAPFYAIGDLTARLLRATGREVAIDGFSEPYVAAVAYGSAFYGFAAIVLSISAARLVGARSRFETSTARGAGAESVSFLERGSTGRAEIVAAVVVWIGTPLLFYMYVAPPYAHAPSAFAVALFVWLWLRVRQSWSVSGAIVLGLAGALMAMVREQDIFFVVGPAVDFITRSLVPGPWVLGPWVQGPWVQGPWSRVLKVAAVGGAAFVIGYIPQLLAYWSLNGYPGPSRLVLRKMIWYSPHMLKVLGSPEHGFLVWTPLAILAIVGLLLLAFHGDDAGRRIGACALMMMALQVYVSGSVDSWTVAGAFGQRRFVAATVLLVIGLAVLLRRVPSGLPRFATSLLVALCVWWNIALTTAFGAGLMNRQRLEIKRNAYAAFVTIPRMVPQLAMRYLVKRDSFYQQRQPPQ